MLGVLQRTPVFDNISLTEIGRLGPFARGKWCIVSGVFFYSVVCMSTCQKKTTSTKNKKAIQEHGWTWMNNILIFLQYWIESIETHSLLLSILEVTGSVTWTGRITTRGDPSNWSSHPGTSAEWSACDSAVYLAVENSWVMAVEGTTFIYHLRYIYTVIYYDIIQLIFMTMTIYYIHINMYVHIYTWYRLSI